MAVTTATVESMVLKLFEHFRVQSGGRLRLEDLRSQWSRTRLRATDLDIGIRELVFIGALHWVDSDEGLLLELSPVGHDMLRQRAMMSDGSLRQLWGEMRLKWTRVRRTPAAGPYNRRYTDPTDPAGFNA